MGRTTFYIYALVVATLGLSDSCILDIGLCGRYAEVGEYNSIGVHVRLLGSSDTLVAVCCVSLWISLSRTHNDFELRVVVGAVGVVVAI